MQPMRGVSAEYQEARFSRDGTRLLLTVGDGAQSDISRTTSLPTRSRA